MKPLSKSKLLAFRQCPKRLWLEIHRPDLRVDSPAAQAAFAVGHTVGEIARRLYDPQGMGAFIDLKALGFADAFAETARLLEKSPAPIFEAGFAIRGALAFADVLLPDARSVGGWMMVEVKSAASLKDYHRDDAAIQSFIARKAGLNLTAIGVAHIDSGWVYPGGEDYQGLLTLNDLTQEALDRSLEVESWLTKAHSIVAQPDEPQVAVGSHCRDPFECGFCAYCHAGLPQPEYPLSLLPRFSTRRKEAFAVVGITEIREVPDSDLNEKQLRVKHHTLAGTTYFDAEGAAADLGQHGFPAYFLDFETIQFAVPIWAGTRPYQQIVFQFSVHTVLSDAQSPNHQAFLDLSGTDPSERLVSALIASCGSSGPIFVYNAGFERGRIADLAKRFPDYADHLTAIIARIVDLLPVAQNRYYHPSQEGSWSIKKVLPAAVPELSYESLDGVQDGGAAMSVFLEAISPTTTVERKAEIEQQLLAYCALDTFAMVRLWEFFRGRSPQTEPSKGNPPGTN